MSDMLSPEEISALLSAYRAAESQGKGLRDKSVEHPVRLYDFARPDKFSKEHIRVLNSIHKKYATMFSQVLTGLLRIPVQADLIAVDQVTYREYCASVPETTLFCDVSLEPLTTTAIFEFNPAVAGACIDGLTGGSGVAFSNISELTDIDKAIMARVTEVLLRKYEEAWAPYIGLNSGVRDSDTRGSFNQMFLPTEPVLICGYEVSLGQSTGMMSICIPAGAIEAILPSLSVGRSVGSVPRHTPATVEALKQSLQEVSLECRVVIGRVALTMSDVVNLQVGDVITLDTKPNSEAEFWVGSTQTCFGIPGRAGKKLGLRVTRMTDFDRNELR